MNGFVGGLLLELGLAKALDTYIIHKEEQGFQFRITAGNRGSWKSGRYLNCISRAKYQQVKEERKERRRRRQAGRSAGRRENENLLEFLQKLCI